MRITNRQLNSLRWIVSTVILALVVYWSLIHKPWIDIAHRIEGKSIWPVLLAIGINFIFCIAVKVIKWRIILKNPPSFFATYIAVLEGMMANIIIGFGMNDWVRSYRLRNNSENFVQDMGASLTDRICEYLALMLFFVLAIGMRVIPAYWLVVPLCYLLFVFVLLKHYGHGLKKLSRFPKVQNILERLGHGLEWNKMTSLTLLSLLNWLIELVMIYLVLGVFQLPNSFEVSLLVLMGINIAVCIPGPPANIGTFEAGVIAALALYGVSAEAALSFGIFYHLIHAVPVATLGGLVWVGKDVISTHQQ